MTNAPWTKVSRTLKCERKINFCDMWVVALQRECYQELDHDGLNFTQMKLFSWVAERLETCAKLRKSIGIFCIKINQFINRQQVFWPFFAPQTRIKHVLNPIAVKMSFAKSTRMWLTFILSLVIKYSAQTKRIRNEVYIVAHKRIRALVNISF